MKGDMRKLDYLASVYEKVMNALDEVATSEIPCKQLLMHCIHVFTTRQADLDAKAGASAEAREEARVARDKSRADAMAKVLGQCPDRVTLTCST